MGVLRMMAAIFCTTWGGWGQEMDGRKDKERVCNEKEGKAYVSSCALMMMFIKGLYTLSAVQNGSTVVVRYSLEWLRLG